MHAWDRIAPSLDATVSRRRWQLVAVALLAAGLFLRLYHYLGDPSIWFDEAVLMVNVEDKSYAELLGPLDNAANGPPLFLWLEKAMSTGLGDQPWVWRLPALTASCLGLGLFFLVARRVLRPDGLAWAVGLFALSDRLLWHSVEVKPYTIDTLVAVGVLAAWLWTDSWPTAPRLLLFTALAPPLFCLSYPAMFVFTAPALLLLGDAWDARRLGTWLCYGLYLGATAVTGAWLVQGPIRAQHQGMAAAGFDWTAQMPDLTSAAKALAWPMAAVFEVLRYCLRPTGGLPIGFAAGGAVWLVRHGQRRLAALMLAPLLAAMAAAYLHRYPCGGGRPMLFMTPAAALLIGCFIPPLLRWCLGAGVARQAKPYPAWRQWCGGGAALSVVAMALIPMVLSLYRVVVPWPRFDCRGAADYVLCHREPEDLVVVNSWDEMYFYRHLDPRWRCGRGSLSVGQGRRCWATFNLAFEPGGPERTLAEHDAWKVAARKQFGQLVVVLLERGGSGP